MATLTNKHILLGVTGGIAAYKAAELVRRLRDAGAEVRVVMTSGATRFIAPLTFQALSGHRVRTGLFEEAESEHAMGHIELARWADAVLVAPASADFLARLNQGRADDLLTTLCLATAAPVAVAPAMNQRMWGNPATQRNVFGLRQLGVQRFGPATGDQACGETGPGRMLEPDELVARTAALFESGSLDGLTVLVTAGPTWEALDPVRGLSNRSSGKMGYAVARAAIEAGARVILVSGPTALRPPDRADFHAVRSAQQMFDAVHAHIADADVFIGVAAVADYRPVDIVAEKIKKDADTLTLTLVRTPDILASVAALPDKPYTVGFAAETQDLERYARDKLEHKGLDLVAANLVAGGAGFEADDNALLLLDRAGHTELPRQSKERLARELISHIARSFHAKDPAQDSRRTYR